MEVRRYVILLEVSYHKRGKQYHPSTVGLAAGLTAGAVAERTRKAVGWKTGIWLYNEIIHAFDCD